MIEEPSNFSRAQLPGMLPTSRNTGRSLQQIFVASQIVVDGYDTL